MNDISSGISTSGSFSAGTDLASEEQTLQQLEQQVDQLISQAMQGGSGSFGGSGTGTDSSGMNAQSASGALASYMNQNGIKSLNENQLYQLAENPPPGTPSDVSSAAQYMLQNPDVYKQIETHDVSGADGKSGASNFEWAAQGGLGSSTDSGGGDSSTNGLNAQSAAGTLASYMNQNGIKSLNENQLYQLAENPPQGTPSAVSDAAKYMLENPDQYKQIETHDVSGADGKSGVSNFEWAAQGGLGASGLAENSNGFGGSNESLMPPLDLNAGLDLSTGFNA